MQFTSLRQIITACCESQLLEKAVLIVAVLDTSALTTVTHFVDLDTMFVWFSVAVNHSLTVVTSAPHGFLAGDSCGNVAYFFMPPSLPAMSKDLSTVTIIPTEVSWREFTEGNLEKPSICWFWFVLPSLSLISNMLSCLSFSTFVYTCLTLSNLRDRF